MLFAQKKRAGCGEVQQKLLQTGYGTVYRRAIEWKSQFTVKILLTW